LHGSLPEALRAELKRHREALNGADDEASQNLHRLMFRRIEEVLDTAKPGVDYLRQPRIAELVARAFDWAERECGWRVPTYSILPNHVHALFAGGDTADRSLSKTLGSIKGFTAHEANDVLGRRGRQFWQHESFDHWCRTAEKEEAVVDYIRNNPVKAGLVADWRDWPWTK